MSAEGHVEHQNEIKRPINLIHRKKNVPAEAKYRQKTKRSNGPHTG